MNKPIALDICCRKGGATKGLQRAGFHVIGVDIDPQPGYVGDEFIQWDGLDVLRDLLNPVGYFADQRPALVWQSWPCQAANTATAGNRAKGDRKSTRLNSSHSQISYAVFCLKKKKNKKSN